LLQTGGDRVIKLGGLGLLLAERGGKALHLHLERLPVVLLRLGTDVTAGCEHMAVLAHLLYGRALAETGDVRVFARVLLAAPDVVGVGDAGDVLVGQLAVRAVHHAAELAGVDEEYVAPAVAERAVLAV